MNIKQLRYFLAVAQELNFTRAAEKIGIAQPPLSQQIIGLEQDLGTQLFIREKRHVRLTAAGEVLVDYAHRVINAAAAAEAAVHMVERGARAHLRVGAIYSALYSFLPGMLRDFRERAPNAELDLREMTIAQQIVGLNEGEIEVGLLRGPLMQRDLSSEILYRERLLLAIPSAMADEFDDPVPLTQIAKHPLISIVRGTNRGYADRVMNVFEAEEITPNIAHVVSDMHTAVCLVAAGMGVSVVPAVIQLMQTNEIVYRELEDQEGSVTFALAMRKDNQSPLIDLFVDAARKRAAMMVAQHPRLFMPRLRA